ncbi:MAG TPA: Gfo/Idh/MocA family oxidoreductase [Chloroflexota bacterium]|nr:Gfo/Idh/MocA family oxidoreductase [Chloroflexota bacterium]
MTAPVAQTESWGYGRVTYSFEYPRRLRVGFVGCGVHSWRNVYPTFQYAPVELVAVADPVEERAAAYARQFGVASHYRDHREMLAHERLDAVFAVTNYDERGHPRYPEIAVDGMRAGAHVWIEKPPAATVEEVQMMLAAERETGKFVQVGYKKMFFPAIAKAKEIISRGEEFGEPAQIYVRYPQALPPSEERQAENRRMVSFLDHFFHPGSIVYRLMGPVRRVSYVREPLNGGSLSTLTFASGAIGVMHLAAGQSGTSPLERVEVIGKGANVVVENGVRLTYYRRGGRGEGGYGRAASFIGPDGGAPLVWEPEFSLGQLYNKNLFTLGYAPEVIYFCERALAGERPAYANLDDTLQLLRWYEAYRQPEGKPIEIDPG